MKVDHKYFFMESWSVTSAADISTAAKFSALKGSPGMIGSKRKDTNTIIARLDGVKEDDREDEETATRNTEVAVDGACTRDTGSDDGQDDGSESGDSCVGHLAGITSKERVKPRFTIPKDEPSATPSHLFPRDEIIDADNVVVVPEAPKTKEKLCKPKEESKQTKLKAESKSKTVRVQEEPPRILGDGDKKEGEDKVRSYPKKNKKKKHKKTRPSNRGLESSSSAEYSDPGGAAVDDTLSDTMSSFVSCVDGNERHIRDRQNRSHVRQIRNLLKRNPNLPIKDEWWKGIGIERVGSVERRSEQYDVMFKYYAQQDGNRPYRQYREKYKNKYAKKKPPPISTQAQGNSANGASNNTPELKRHGSLDHSRVNQFSDKKTPKQDEKKSPDPTTTNNVAEPKKPKRSQKKKITKSDRLMSNPALLAAALVLKAPLPGGPCEGPQEFSEAARNKMKVPVFGVSGSTKEKQIANSSSSAPTNNRCGGIQSNPIWMCCSSLP